MANPKHLVESKNRNKSGDRKMLYPTAKDFDDLFSDAILCTDGEDNEQPHGWDRPWVVDYTEEETGRRLLSAATIGPYCSVSWKVNDKDAGRDLWVRARDHLVDTIKDTMRGIPEDNLYFDISCRSEEAVVSVNYSSVIGHKIVARIKWSSVPYQLG